MGRLGIESTYWHSVLYRMGGKRGMRIEKKPHLAAKAQKTFNIKEGGEGGVTYICHFSQQERNGSFQITFTAILVV